MRMAHAEMKKLDPTGPVIENELVGKAEDRKNELARDDVFPRLAVPSLGLVALDLSITPSCATGIAPASIHTLLPLWSPW